MPCFAMVLFAVTQSSVKIAKSIEPVWIFTHVWFVKGHVHMKKLFYLAVAVLALVNVMPLNARAGEINDSGASETLGLGVLGAIAAPVLITAGAVGLAGEAGASAANTASDLTGAALDATSAVAQVGADSAAITAIGASMVAGSVVKLVDDSGHGLRELTIDAIDESANTLVSDTRSASRPVPRVSADINGQRREIPLVVRPSYVQMNQKVEGN